MPRKRGFLERPLGIPRRVDIFLRRLTLFAVILLGIWLSVEAAIIIYLDGVERSLKVQEIHERNLEMFQLDVERRKTHQGNQSGRGLEGSALGEGVQKDWGVLGQVVGVMWGWVVYFWASPLGIGILGILLPPFLYLVCFVIFWVSIMIGVACVFVLHAVLRHF